MKRATERANTHEITITTQQGKECNCRVYYEDLHNLSCWMAKFNVDSVDSFGCSYPVHGVQCTPITYHSTTLIRICFCPHSYCNLSTATCALCIMFLHCTENDKWIYMICVAANALITVIFKDFQQRYTCKLQHTMHSNISKLEHWWN